MKRKDYKSMFDHIYYRHSDLFEELHKYTCELTTLNLTHRQVMTRFHKKIVELYSSCHSI